MRLTIAWLCLAAVLGAQPQTVLKTETRVVLVDAIVTDKKGDYIRDLSAKDFRIWEDNKEQTIQSLSVEKGAAGQANARVRYLVLFFAGMDASDQMLARQTVSNFVDANAGENRKMAVVTYNGDLRIAQNFTDDAGRLKEGVNRAMSSGLAPGSADLAALNTTRALGTLARNLGVLPGRKIVVLLSGALQSSSMQKAELTSAIEACNKSDVAVYPIDVRPLSSQQGTRGDVRGASEGATEAPGIRVRGQGQLQGDAPDPTLPQDAGGNNQQILFTLANGTGGFVIPNFGELQRGLQKIGEEQAEYYTISYAPPDSPSGVKAGGCHALRVKVDRGGTTVRARTNYCATKPQDLLAGTSAGQDLERRAIEAQPGGQPGSIAASMQISYFYILPGVARAKLAMEIPPDALKFENRKGKLHAEVDFLGIASNSEGGVGARFSDALKFDFDTQAQIENLKAKPVHYEKEFKIAPGRYNFALAIGSGGESFGKLEMPLAVDARVPGELAMSGLALSRETHPAAELGLGGSLIEDRTPLIAENMEVIPSGSNQFTKSESGFVYLEVYTTDPAAVRMRLRVVDRKTGEAKSDSGPLKLSLPKNQNGDAIPAGSRLPINELAAGSYQLEVTAEDAAGKQVKRTADFEVR
jgi:VWFA-related protein